jgi:hypothetical protein
VQYYKKFDFSPERFVGTTATYNLPSFQYGNDNFFLHHAMIREWRDDFSISASSHNIKFGADIQNNPLHEDAQGNPSGTWTFGRSTLRSNERGDAAINWRDRSRRPSPG